jgi:very-short-patch-repair endonuclease
MKDIKTVKAILKEMSLKIEVRYDTDFYVIMSKKPKLFIPLGNGNVSLEDRQIFETQKNLKVKFLKASKASLKILQPLYTFLIDNNIFDKDDIFLGIEGVKEFFIKTVNNIYFYDFTIKSKKIIVEYNGKAWHPNWEKYSIEDCIKNFSNKKIDAKKAIEKDKNKINTAKENGFNVLILWEEDGYDYNQQKLKNFLIQNNINYEN